MPELNPNSSDVAALAQQYETFHGAQFHTVADPDDDAVKAPVVVLPEGKRVHSLTEYLDEFRDYPTRTRGTAKIRDLASFIAHVNRFKDANSVIFAAPDVRDPRLVAVYNYNEVHGEDGVAPRFGDHRAAYHCELSSEWKSWAAQAGQQMSQGDFAAFLEDRIQDVALIDGPHIKEIADLLGARPGGPSSLLQLSRGLQVSVNNTVHNAVTLATGEVRVTFTETHADESGAPIQTPNLFFLAIPVFMRGEPYQVPIRLRYRVQGGKLLWSYLIHRADKIFEDAFKAVVDGARTECELPI